MSLGLDKCNLSLKSATGGLELEGLSLLALKSLQVTPTDSESAHEHTAYQLPVGLVARGCR
jgi:hypothetical protein